MIRIVTDRAADLPQQDIDDLGITVAPLYIQFPEGEVDSADLTPDQFYDRLRAMAPDVPTTAQPAPGIFADLYREMNSDDDGILSIHISSGLSGTIQSAGVAAAQMEIPVEMVDTMTLSGGQRFQVVAAAQAAQRGWSREAIIERLEQIRAKTEVVFTLETLEYLARGGRIGRVQALAGTLLKLKPVIHVDQSDGKYSTVGKARTLKRTRQQIVSFLADTYGPDEPLWVSVMHGQFSDQAETLASELEEMLTVKKLEILRISPVLGVHTGPGIVGAAVVPMSLMAISGQDA
jgi:DegV family protein with EDD domain